LFKRKGSRSDPSAYRPISILPLLSKLFEKIIFRKLYQYVEQENLLDSRQHGFRRNRSCVTALSVFLNDLTTNMDEPNMLAGVLYVDLKKAFDSIRPLKLLLLLFDIKIPDIILLYLCLYFLRRTFKIKLEDFLSSFYRLVRGVPQGSILAPLLFSLFFNGVGSAVLSKFYGMFADDLSITCFNKNLDDLINDLSKIMESLDIWCRERDLIISYAKTKYMIFSKTSLCKLLDIPTLSCNGNIIERVDNFKYLGIFFDSSLSFKFHFDYVCSRVSSAVGCMLFIKRFLNLDTFRTLLNAFVLSIIDYGLIIWGKVSDSKIKILQGKVNNVLGSFFYPQICNRFQRVNKIAHFYEHKSFQLPTINYYNLYEQCNIFTIEERLLYFYGIFCFKSIRNNHIPELKESFKFSHSARSQNISILQHHSDFFE